MSIKLRSDSLINERDGRDQNGRIIRMCGCVSHEQWTADVDELPLYKIKESKKFSIAVIDEMRHNKLLTPKGNILCNVCYRRY